MHSHLHSEEIDSIAVVNTSDVAITEPIEVEHSSSAPEVALSSVMMVLAATKAKTTEATLTKMRAWRAHSVQPQSTQSRASSA